jgi:hypothetical protein
MLDKVKQSLVGWISGKPNAARLGGWHKWNPGNAVLLRDGSWSRVGRGQNWRRRTADGWEVRKTCTISTGTSSFAAGLRLLVAGSRGTPGAESPVFPDASAPVSEFSPRFPD